MSKVRIHNIVVSLDGFATGEGPTFASPFGHAQDLMMSWFTRARIWRGTQDAASVINADESIADAWEKGIGAEIMGRGKFGPQQGPWTDEEWRGWWGDNPPFHTPCFILTHYPRPSIEMQGGTTYHFIDATSAEALKVARKAAGVDALDNRGDAEKSQALVKIPMGDVGARGGAGVGGKHLLLARHAERARVLA